MNLKKILIGASIAVVFVSSCIAGYLTLKYKNSSSKVNVNDHIKADVKKASLKTKAAFSDSSNYDIISANTKIVKRYNYNLGVPTTKEITEAAGPEVLGMDRKTAEEFYKKQQFLITEFNPTKVILFRDIDSWPPNSYVVKGEKGKINIYYTDSNGVLQFLKKSQYTLDSLPDTDRKDLEKGKSFPKLEDIDNMFDELDS